MSERDSGRYDALTDSWVDQQVRVDFAWGNIPMQPNDDRGMAQLDPALDSHIIATSNYEGFPAFTPGYPFDDTITNVEVPNVVGLTLSAAQTAIASAGLDYSSTTTTSGANSGNDGKVKSQSPVAGTLVNVSNPAGDTVISLVVYNNPQALVPNLSGLNWSAANAAITGAGFIVGTTATDVDTSNLSIANTVASQSPAAGTYANVGSAIDYHLYNYVAPELVSPTNVWSHYYYDMTFEDVSSIPGDLATNPTNYKVVLSGGSHDGDYTIQSATLASWGSPPETGTGLKVNIGYIGVSTTHGTGSHLTSQGAPDNAVASIVPV